MLGLLTKLKKYFSIALLLVTSSTAYAQNTTVTGTITDSDNIAWANGTINFTLTASSQTLYCSGTPITSNQANVTVSLDGSGSFSTSLCSNSNITPVTSQWAISVCSATTAPCQNIASTTINGSSQSLTSYISNLIKPLRISAIYGTIAYSDIEILSPANGFIYFNLASGISRQWSGSGWSNIGSGSSPIIPGNIYLYCNAVGMKCDGVTDDTAAFQTLLNTVNAAGGGVIQGATGKTSLILGQITFPKNSTTPWSMSPIRITGSGASFGAADNAIGGFPGTPFTIDARFAGSRFIVLGQGTLEFDHINLINGGTSCGSFFQSTLTNLKLHDNSIFGSITNGGSTNSCDDFLIAGGTRGVNLGLDGTINDYFQGYGSVIQNNFADYIRSFVVGRIAFDGIPIVNNTIWKHSGSNATTTITAATNANPVVLTSTGHSFPVGTGVTLTFSGFTGNWTSLNGAHAITVIDANTFSVAIDSTSFGALTGTPVYLSGSAISIDGTATSGNTFSDIGNFISGNLIEQSNYPFAYRLGSSAQNTISGASAYDATATSVACVWQQTLALASFIQISHCGTSGILSQNAITNNGSFVSVGGTFQPPFLILNSTGQPQLSFAINGTTFWQSILAGSGTQYRITDITNGLTRLQFTQGSSSLINSAGTAGVAINSTTNSGTGGAQFFSGGATPTQTASVSGLGASIFTNITDSALVSGNLVKSGTGGLLADTGVLAPISNAVTTATGGSGTSTVTCTTASCTNLRGSYTVASGTFTTGTILTLVWPTTTTAYVCSGSVFNGTTGASIGYHTVATATGIAFTTLTSPATVTVDIDYACHP